MKAFAITDFDKPPAVVDKPVPNAGEGEIVVDVKFASLNGMDLMVSLGYMKDAMPYELPLTLGRDFAGTIRALGPGVSGLAVGDAVFGALASATLFHGTLAEQLVISAATVAKQPAELDDATASALALAGTAAQAAIQALDLGSDDTVLVSGATGGVGSFAVQLAKRCGATVIATATGDGADFVRGLGADETVDHTGDLGEAVRVAAPDGLDAVVHAAGDPNALADLLQPGGRIASLLGFGAEAVGDRDVVATRVMSIPTGDSLRDLAELAGNRDLRVPITSTYELDDAAQALADFGSTKHGKLSVSVS